MAKKVAPQKQNQNASNWWIVGIAVLALIISLVAWNNSRKYNGEYQQVQTEMRDMQQQMKLDQARQQLEQVRRDIEQSKNLEETQQKITAIKEDLRMSFQDTDEKTLAYWQDLDQKFQQLETGLKENSLNVLEVLDSLLEKLKTKLTY